MQKKVNLIADGACVISPGPGGWACILQYGDQKKEFYGCERNTTTNHRMEMMAVIAGLNALQEPCDVLVTTDSSYVKDGLMRKLEDWKKHSWMCKARKFAGQQPVSNRDLWEQLDELKRKHPITLDWVKRHADHPDKGQCYELAIKAAREQLSLSALAVLMASFTA